MLDGKSVLVTGGTGSFGKQFVRTILEKSKPRRVIVFSRDELKQYEMANDPAFREHRNLRFFLGDVRDADRLYQAFREVDVVVHAAALKQVPACEYNPFEAIRTNVLGAQNVISAALERGVERVVALSTDKACNPINLYGASKLASDKLFVAGNSYVGQRRTRMAVVRYGNVVGSRGSVIPLFLKLRDTGKLPITHPEMTRFWITLPQGVQFVLTALQTMQGGEIFVPKIPSMRVVDLARAIGGPTIELEDVGIRHGEKLHEMMISRDDARMTREFDSHYTIIAPGARWFERDDPGGNPVPENFEYVSNKNTRWLTAAELADIIRPFVPRAA